MDVERGRAGTLAGRLERIEYVNDDGLQLGFSYYDGRRRLAGPVGGCGAYVTISLSNPSLAAIFTSRATRRPVLIWVRHNALP